MKIRTGIVLMGGQSTRMGTDKSLLAINGQYWYQVAAQKLLLFCNEIYLSVNESQSDPSKYEFPIIKDQFPNQGPIGGMLTCHETLHKPLLIMAVDLLDIKPSDIERLLNMHRENKKGCTMFYNETYGYYEPLLAVWDINTLDKLKTYYEKGGRSLQNFLKDQNIKKHPIPLDSDFSNFNTMEDIKS